MHISKSVANSFENSLKNLSPNAEIENLAPNDENVLNAIYDCNVKHPLIDAFDELLDRYKFSDDSRDFLLSNFTEHIRRMIEVVRDGAASEFYDWAYTDAYAYGNDAEYWHDEFSKLSDSLEIVESSYNRQCEYLKNLVQDLMASRDEWKSKCLEVSMEFDSLKNSTPDFVSWPELPNGEFILPGTRAKVISMNKTIVVDYIKIVDSSPSVIIVDKEGNEYCELEFDVPEPDTPASILEELAPNLSKDEIDAYISRLNRAASNAESE